MKQYNFLDYTDEEKALREDIREKADMCRIKWALIGLSDIFEILENEAILIRMPKHSKDFSGFTTYLNNKFVVFINSAYTLGHERFSGGHELAHLELHRDRLVSNNLINDDEEAHREANMFAVEFLMPVKGVREIFKKLVNVEPTEVTPRHVIIMHHYFKVSYKAMLKRLVYLGLCDLELYEPLADYCSLENAELLKELTRKEGFDCSLITYSEAYYVSPEYIKMIRSNYETGKISFKRMERLLEEINRRPEDYGYEVQADDY